MTYGLKGGQGRSAEDIGSSAAFIGWVAIACAFWIIVAIACVRLSP